MRRAAYFRESLEKQRIIFRKAGSGTVLKFDQPSKGGERLEWRLQIRMLVRPRNSSKRRIFSQSAERKHRFEFGGPFRNSGMEDLIIPSWRVTWDSHRRIAHFAHHQRPPELPRMVSSMSPIISAGSRCCYVYARARLIQCAASRAFASANPAIHRSNAWHEMLRIHGLRVNRRDWSNLPRCDYAALETANESERAQRGLCASFGSR